MPARRSPGCARSGPATHGAAGMALSSLATMTSAHRVYGRLGYERDPGRDWSPLPGVDLLAFSKSF